MKKIIIIALVSFTSTLAYSQNNNNNYSYNKEGLTQEDIQQRETWIREHSANEGKNLMDIAKPTPEVVQKVEVQTPKVYESNEEQANRERIKARSSQVLQSAPKLNENPPSIYLNTEDPTNRGTKKTND